PPLGTGPGGPFGWAAALAGARTLDRTNPPTALTPYIMCRRDETTSGRDFDNTLIPRKSTLLITLHLPTPLTTDAKNTTSRNIRRPFWLIQVLRAILGKRRAGEKTSKDNTVGKKVQKDGCRLFATGGHKKRQLIFDGHSYRF